MQDYKIIVAHPGKQHSFRLAAALKKEGILFKYITTVYDKESSYLMKIVKKFLNEDNYKRANSRKSGDLSDEDVKQYCEFKALVTLLILRLDKSKQLYRWWNRRVANSFGRKVAKYAIDNNVDAVIMYDSTALECFKILSKKAPNIKRILDASIANRLHTKTIYDDEIKKTEAEEYISENKYMWNKKIMNELENEIEYTQHFLVPSKYVKESYLFSGVNNDQINIVPYGFNISNEKKVERPRTDEFVNFLLVGQVIYRKGINYLAEAFSMTNRDNIKLNIVGKLEKNSQIADKIKCNKNVKLWGMVTHDKMKDIYNQADVFVLPSLSEGMSLAGLEAMAFKLPIICTTNTGVNDLVDDGVNGFVVPIGDADAIKEKIEWFADNTDKILPMGKNAQERVLKYRWSDYEKNIVSKINNILNISN